MSETNSLEYSASNYPVSSRFHTRFEEKSDAHSKNTSRQQGTVEGDGDGDEEQDIYEDEKQLDINLMKKLYRQSYTLELDDLKKEHEGEDVDYGQEDAEVLRMKEAYKASATHHHHDDHSPRKGTGSFTQSSTLSRGNSTAFQIKSTYVDNHSLSEVFSEGDIEGGLRQGDEMQLGETAAARTLNGGRGRAGRGEGDTGRSARADESHVSEVSLDIDDLPAHYEEIYQRIKDGKLDLHVDMGAKPQFYAGKTGRQSRKVVLIPESEPKRIIVPYGQFRPRYYPKERFHDSRLKEHIKEGEFDSTVAIADMLMRPNLAKAISFDFAMIIAITIGLATTLLTCIILWVFFSIWASVAVAGAYIVILSHMTCITKKKNNKYLQAAHHILAIFLKDENQRYYYRRGIRVRPGYQGKWIEFCIRH